MDLSYIVNFHGKQNLAMNNMTIKSITWQVLDGIKYLHENWVAAAVVPMLCEW